MSFWSLCIMATIIIMPPIGSAGSAIIFLMSIVAWAIWMLGKQKISLTRTEKIVMVAVGYYFLSTLFCSVIRAEKFTDTVLVWNNLGLVFGLSLLPVLRVRIDDSWMDKIVVSVAISGVVLAAVTLILTYQHSYNFKLFSGNALILAYLAGLNAILGLIFFFNIKNLSALSLIGTVGSLFALVMTGRRGPLLAVILVFLPILVLSARQNFGKIAILILSIAIGGGSVVAIKGPSVFDSLRISQTLERLTEPMNPAIGERGIFLRLSMYQNGLEAFKKAPLLGYGRQNTVQAATEQGLQKNPEFAGYGFSHLHNALLTEAVASGILGIVGLIGLYFMPLIVSWRGTATVRLIGVSYSIYLLLYGLSNIGFYHDVTVFSYVFIVGLLNALANQHGEKLDMVQ